jgi:predicted Rossmann-fold nucleotide-binding protein
VERARYYAEFYRIAYEGHATHSDLPLRTHETMYDSERARHLGFLDACDAVLVLVGGVETYHELFHVLHENEHTPKPVCVLDPAGRFASLRAILTGLRTPGVTWCDRIEDVGAWVSRALAPVAQHPEHQ